MQTSNAIMAAARAVHAAVHQNGQQLRDVRTAHADFAEAFPAIFGFVTATRDFDFGMLEFMLDARGGMSPTDADSTVFSRLKQRYVDPLLEQAGLPTDAPVAGEEAVIGMLSRGEGPALSVGNK